MQHKRNTFRNNDFDMQVMLLTQKYLCKGIYERLLQK